MRQITGGIRDGWENICELVATRSIKAGANGISAARVKSESFKKKFRKINDTRCNDAALLQSRLALLHAVLRLLNVRFSLYAHVVPKKRSGNIFVASYTYTTKNFAS